MNIKKKKLYKIVDRIPVSQDCDHWLDCVNALAK
jgi:hypothetical protein